MPRWCLVLMPMFVSACSLWPAQSIDPQWRQHRDSLQGLDTWQLEGRVAITGEDQALTGKLVWYQHGEVFQILLTSAMNQGGIEIRGESGRVVLRTDSGETRELTGRDTRLLSLAGWRLPIQGLRYWLRGVPAPGARAKKQLDELGRLRWLEQTGWRIEYSRYQPVGGYLLPRRLRLTHNGLSLKLVIHQWLPERNG